MTIGIICEYNPFHNGHIYHLNEIKKQYPKSTIVLCLNGYFLERGEISILSKEAKVKIALSFGVDIVIELPVLYGTQSADKFAEASIILLNSVGVEKIVFGSETCDINHFESLAKKQLQEEFKIKQACGLSYPALLNQALNEHSQIMPNDLLGISYIKAILKLKLPIQYEALKRTNDYHDTTSCNEIISASNIREKIKTEQNITKYLPNEALSSITHIDEKLLFTLLKVKIITDNHLDSYLDVTEGLDNKLKKEIEHANKLDDLILAVKSKRYTYNRIKRMIIHILLGIQKQDANEKIVYMNILGFSQEGRNYLKKNRQKILLPTKINYNSKQYLYEKRASELYAILSHSASSQFDKKNQPIVLNLLNDSNQK